MEIWRTRASLATKSVDYLLTRLSLSEIAATIAMIAG